MGVGRDQEPETVDLPAQGAVLVLGAGFIGATIVRDLLDRGYSVRVITRSEPDEHRGELLAGAELFIGDAREMSSLAAALNDIDHVVYALGSSSPVESDLDPAHDIELIVPPLIRLLELLRLRPHVHLTFLSSGGTVYGHQPPGPIHERALAQPISSYGIIKLTCENYIAMYVHAHGITARILRIANAYGPGQRAVGGQGLIARLMQCAASGEYPPLFGSQHSVRDYIYIDDIAGVVVDLIEAPAAPHVLNIGSGVGWSVAGVVELVEDVTGAELTVSPLAARTCDVQANVLDISSVRGLVTFEPLDLRSGVERTWKALLDGNGEVREPRPPRLPAGAPH